MTKKRVRGQENIIEDISIYVITSAMYIDYLHASLKRDLQIYFCVEQIPKRHIAKCWKRHRYARKEKRKQQSQP